MTHTLTLPPWHTEHFRKHDKCLLLLAVLEDGNPDPFKNLPHHWRLPDGRHVWSSVPRDAGHGGYFKIRECPYQPGDVIDFGDFRKLVVSETAKMAEDCKDGDALGMPVPPQPWDYLWNADHPETPWSDSLWLWAIELEDAT